MNRIAHRFALLLAPMLALAAGCVSDQQVIAQAQQLHGQIEPTVIDRQSPELAAYVQEVGDRIVAAAEEMYEEGKLPGAEDWMFEDVRFHLVASPQLNAFTTGGKHIYLYTELFEKSQSEAAFAAVVGHEFGHIIGRHVQDSMNNQLLAGLASAGLVGGAALLSDEETRGRNTAIAGAAAGLGATAGITYFGREKEREADELGYEFYVRAGYPPEEFADFFKTLIAESGGAGPGGVQGFFSTHPNLQERVESAERRAEQTPPRVAQRYDQPPIAAGREFERLQGQSRPLTQAAARQAQQPGGEALREAMAILEAFPSCLAGEAAVE